jgi:hypothetical protein
LQKRWRKHLNKRKDEQIKCRRRKAFPVRCSGDAFKKIIPAYRQAGIKPDMKTAAA